MNLSAHNKQFEFLKKKFEANQLSHAYLFVGPKGIGKKSFAEEFVNFIGCKFPDLLIIESVNSTSSIKNKKDSLEIDIGQIRGAQKFLSYKSYNGGIKIIIIDNAERMNQEAQSCFLKTLEEPKGKTLIILITSKPAMLLPTISSRCQALKFFKSKNITFSPEKLERGQKLLNDLTPLFNSTLAEKFKYVKSIDFEQQDAGEILEVAQEYFREKLLNDVSDKKSKKILKLIEEINNKLIFTNASPKLALEMFLMEL